MRLRTFVGFLLACCVCLCGFSAATDLALIGATVYPSPTAPPIESGAILIHEGRIAAVGPRSSVKIPKGTKVIDCTGMVVTAGFWNSHVHLMLPTLLHAEERSSNELSSQLQEMLTRWGFTTVFDLASRLDNTNTIRRRIERGELKGPRILTVGEPFWIKGGTPMYVQDYLRTNHVIIPEVESIIQAKQRVHQQIHGGADAIKIWTGSPEPTGVVLMPLEMATAIVTEAHHAGKLVFAHPTNDEGVDIAIRSGTDILAHTSANGKAWPASLVKTMIEMHMSLIPTLTLWHVESAGSSSEAFEEGMRDIVLPQLRTYSQAGGQILFGTDVGYIHQFDTTEEFQWMSRAGMTFQQILASLTTSPAARFGYARHCGVIATGMDADVVVLSEDPQRSVSAFSKVRYTIRHGDVIYNSH